ncbi:LamG-like jellyroll fold domain-containing protein [Pikeienuella sp. HZG-20]|uniref:LamG-like jellyroll fold domain-containing protein n=1 Tax=Paludibacillus litoralis TaxID=3133267 RepID=UPI0030EF4DA3
MATVITPSPIWSLGNIDVDGLGDARVVSHKAGYELANGALTFTVTADSAGGRQGLFSKDHEYFGDGGHFTVWIDNGKILARLQSEDSSYELRGGDVNAGEPVAVAVAFGARGFELWVDGEMVDRNDYTGGLQGNQEPIVVGASQWAAEAGPSPELTQKFEGQITDMDLYDEALSRAEIRALAETGVVAPEPEPSEPAAPAEPENAAPSESEGSPSQIWSLGNIDVDGLSDAREIPHKAGYELANGALTFTVTADSAGGRQGLFSKDYEYFGDGGHFTVWIDNGKILARLQSEDSSYELRGGDVNAGEPVAVAVTFGAGGFELYVDGEMVDRNDYTGGLQGNQEPIVVGASQWAAEAGPSPELTHRFKGQITDMGLYDEALSGAEIRALAETGVVAPEPEPTEPAAPTEPEDSPSQIWSLGNIDVDGLSDAREIPHKAGYELANGALTFTVTADSAGGRQGLFSKDHEYFGDGGHFTVWIDNGKILARLQSEDSSYELRGGDVNAGEPVSVAVTFGAGGFELYVDGEMVDRNDYTGGLQGNQEPIVVGASQWAAEAGPSPELTHRFKGQITDMGLYDEALSGAEIRALAETGVVAPEPEPEPTEPAAPTEPENAAPEVTGDLDTLSVDEGETGVVDLADLFADPDGDALVFSLKGAPGFVSIDADGRLIAAPADGNDGTYNFTILASDGDATSKGLDATLVVDDSITSGGDGAAPEPEPSEPENAAPKVTGDLDTLSVDEGETGRVDLADLFTDPDGDALTFKLKNAPDFVSIDADGRLVAAPADGNDGTYDFTVLASDGDATSKGLGVTLVVDDSITSGGDSSGGGGFSADPVTLTAGRGILKNGTVGPQEWGDGVVLSAYDLNGGKAEVGYSEQFDDHGFGVKGSGSRWDGQIDYYASGGGRSEKMVIDFNGDVTDVVLRVGMVGDKEGPNGTPESGVWKAYDASGKLVDKDLIGPDQSTLGAGVKEKGSYGIYPIEIDTDAPIARIELEATQFDYGRGSSVGMSYGENSSDYNVMGIEFQRLEPVGDFLL